MLLHQGRDPLAELALAVRLRIEALVHLRELALGFLRARGEHVGLRLQRVALFLREVGALLLLAALLADRAQPLRRLVRRLRGRVEARPQLLALALRAGQVLARLGQLGANRLQL